MDNEYDKPNQLSPILEEEPEKQEAQENQIEETVQNESIEEIKIYEITEDISLLPNNQNNVWFNGIFVALLFSDRIRNLIYDKIKSYSNVDDVVKILRRLIELIENAPEKFKNEFDKNENKILLEQVLLKSSNVIRDINNLKWCEYDIITILNKLNINLCDLFVTDNSTYIDFFKYISYNEISKKWRVDINQISRLNVRDIPKKLEDMKKKYEKNPELLILFYKDMNSITTFIKKSTSAMEENESLKLFTPFFNPNSYKIQLSYENLLTTGEITFNGETYVLDVCLLNNNDFMSNTHCTVGITNRGKRYTFNNWRHRLKNTEKSGNCPNSCALFDYDWFNGMTNPNKDEYNHCFNPFKCNLNLDYTVQTLKDLCFSFTKGDRMLIFVKKDVPLATTESQKIVTFKRNINENKIRELILGIEKLDKPTLKQALKLINKDKYDKYDDLDVLKKALFDEFAKKLFKPQEQPPKPQEPKPQEPPKPEESKLEESKQEITAGGKGRNMNKSELIAYIMKMGKKIQGLNKMKKDELMKIYSKLKLLKKRV